MTSVVRVEAPSIDCTKSRNGLSVRVRDSTFRSLAGRNLKVVLVIDNNFNAGRFLIVLGNETNGILVRDKSCKRVNLLIPFDRPLIFVLMSCRSTNDDGRYSISKINSLVKLHKDVWLMTNFRRCWKHEMNFGIHVSSVMYSSVIVECSPSIADVGGESIVDCFQGT